jgi:hypothetical protein
MTISPDEMIKIQDYMRRTFANPAIAVKPRAQDKDSLEILLKGEFIGLLYKNVEDGETSYDFNMSILDIDLE